MRSSWRSASSGSMQTQQCLCALSWSCLRSWRMWSTSRRMASCTRWQWSVLTLKELSWTCDRQTCRAILGKGFHIMLILKRMYHLWFTRITKIWAPWEIRIDTREIKLLLGSLKRLHRSLAESASASMFSIIMIHDATRTRLGSHMKAPEPIARTWALAMRSQRVKWVVELSLKTTERSYTLLLSWPTSSQMIKLCHCLPQDKAVTHLSKTLRLQLPLPLLWIRKSASPMWVATSVLALTEFNQILMAKITTLMAALHSMDAWVDTKTLEWMRRLRTARLQEQHPIRNRQVAKSLTW